MVDKSNVEPLTSRKALTCGLVMPISATDGCPAEHWLEVKSIVTEAVESIADPSFVVKLVSDADDIGVIQKRIVQNLYGSDMVVCDVSGKNPNVMFELGMRLAFDKPVVIIKDDKTDYSFDTGIIEHLAYPRDLRFQRIVEFKRGLSAKVLSTYKAATSDNDHSPFLKNFGKFQVASLTEQEVPAERLVLSMLEELSAQVSMLRRQQDLSGRSPRHLSSGLREVRAAVRDYVEKEKITSAEQLIGNATFYSAIETAVAAPRYFQTLDEFHAAVDSSVIAVLTK